MGMIARPRRVWIFTNFRHCRSDLTCRFVGGLAYLVFLMSAFLVVASSAVRSEKLPTPKAVFVIVDGVPADVVERVSTPEIDLISMSGGYARSSVGGPIDEPGETPTISAPGYMSLLTGTWSNKHNVRTNYQLSPNYEYWNIFRLLKYLHPALKIGIFSTWTDNRTVLLGEGLQETSELKFDYVIDGLEINLEWLPPEDQIHHIKLIDDIISIKSTDTILSHGPDLSWIYLQYTDDVGHRFGDGPELDQAVRDMDSYLGKLRVAVETRQSENDEDWLLLVTTDHGRDIVTGRSHGGQSERERTTWIATNSQHLLPEFYRKPEIVDIFPSIVAHFGLDLPEHVARHLDGKTFIER